MANAEQAEPERDLAASERDERIPIKMAAIAIAFGLGMLCHASFPFRRNAPKGDEENDKGEDEGSIKGAALKIGNPSTGVSSFTPPAAKSNDYNEEDAGKDEEGDNEEEEGEEEDEEEEEEEEEGDGEGEEDDEKPFPIRGSVLQEFGIANGSDSDFAFPLFRLATFKRTESRPNF